MRRGRIEGLPSDAQHTTPMQRRNPEELREQKSPRQHPVWISPTNNVQLVNKLDCLVTHEEADITLCSYMLEAAASCAEMVMIVCDDTDVFVLLVYWT